MERRYIKKYDSFKNGYNSTKGGDDNPMKYKENSIKVSGKKHPMYGKTHSDESKAKMSAARRGKNNPLYGKHHSKKTKEKISQANIGKIRSEEMRRHMSEIMYIIAPFRNKKHTEESKRKNARAHIGKKWSNSTRKKQILIRTGKRLTDEQKEKMATTRGIKLYVYKSGVLVGIWNSITRCSNELKLTSSNISACIHGRQLSHKGYTFVKKLDAKNCN
jgi:hypothetical protein